MFANVQNINDLISLLPVPQSGDIQPIRTILNALASLGSSSAALPVGMFSALTQVIGNGVTALQVRAVPDAAFNQYQSFDLFEDNLTAIDQLDEKPTVGGPDTPLGYKGVDLSVATTTEGNGLQSNGVVQDPFGTLPWDPLNV